MPRKQKGDVNRRTFVSAMATGSAALALGSDLAGAMAPSAARAATPAGPAADMSAQPDDGGFIGRSGSDYMVDAIKQLGIDYVAAMAGSSFRGLHESIINYGSNRSPQLLTCLHEEISVALCHGYAKVAGKPMAALLHGVVGVQHASMAIYNAWCDRVPILLIGGNTLDAAKRRQGPEWQHSVLDNAAIVRDFVKWDGQPVSLEDFDEALKRAYALAVTTPSAPVLLMADSELQEKEIAGDLRPKAQAMRPSLPVGDPAALAEAANLLVAAKAPVIVADRLVRTQHGMDLLVTLAELLQAPVIDRYSRLNMPNTHYLAQAERGRGLIGGADVILGLELTDPWGAVNTMVDIQERHSDRLAKPDAKLIHVTTHDLLIKANFQDFQRYQPADLQISGDGEATLPYLIEAVRRAATAGGRDAIEGRRGPLRTAYDAMRKRARQDAAYAWNASPVSTARLCAELWMRIKGEDWALVGGDSQFRSNWPQRLWDMSQAYHFQGSAGGAGVGYCAPAAVGAALALSEHGRLAVNIQGDGDLMCCTGALWTAAHHKIPLLTVMHNNRAYHQEMMHVQRMANRRARGIDRCGIGTAIDDPAIDYAKLAQSMGVEGIGPISDPQELGPALGRAIEIVKRGEPVLVDVVAQPR